MNKFFKFLVITLCMIIAASCYANSDKNSVLSTQGVEVDQTTIKKINNHSHENVSFYKKQKKAKKKYIKNITNIKKLKEKNIKKQKDLDYYQKRLNTTEAKLKGYTSQGE